MKIWIAAASITAALAGVWWALDPAVPTGRPTAADSQLDAVQQTIGRGKPAVVQFGANACAACRQMKPVLAALQRQHGKRIEVLSVDLIADKRFGYLQRYKIQLMPTQIFYDAEGRETGRHLGALDAAQILARLGVAGGPSP